MTTKEKILYGFALIVSAIGEIILFYSIYQNTLPSSDYQEHWAEIADVATMFVGLLISTPLVFVAYLIFNYSKHKNIQIYSRWLIWISIAAIVLPFIIAIVRDYY